MAAIVSPHPAGRPNRPHLVLVGPDYRPPRPAPVRRAPSKRVAYRRRRLAVAVAIVALVFVVQLVLHTASAWLGGGSLTASEPRSAVAATASASSVHVVQPGDTLWTLARRAQPTGDVRPLVGRLSAAHEGRALRPGQRIVLP